MKKGIFAFFACILVFGLSGCNFAKPETGTTTTEPMVNYSSPEYGIPHNRDYNLNFSKSVLIKLEHLEQVEKDGVTLDQYKTPGALTIEGLPIGPATYTFQGEFIQRIYYESVEGSLEDISFLKERFTELYGEPIQESETAARWRLPEELRVKNIQLQTYQSEGAWYYFIMVNMPEQRISDN